eukprot:c19367_g1_i2.p1 GENE.c19367_g1_i2~~c19367_g1_i2.p1  ORF type:complete len:149 (+),score=29.14 c19367_g1_i2:484-930(+)
MQAQLAETTEVALQLRAQLATANAQIEKLQVTLRPDGSSTAAPQGSDVSHNDDTCTASITTDEEPGLQRWASAREAEMAEELRTLQERVQSLEAQIRKRKSVVIPAGARLVANSENLSSEAPKGLFESLVDAVFRRMLGDPQREVSPA